jgi:hypothetical protein
VQLVKTPDTGVPKTGATNVLFVNVSVPVRVASLPDINN